MTIWDGDAQSFNVGPLRQAMLVRGFTPEALADAAGVARGTLYNALHGRPTRLRTAHRILAALAETRPILRLGLPTRED
jgi:predicted transcriptional regulator